MYKIADSEIGYVHGKNAIGLILACFAPEILRRLPDAPITREGLKAMQHMFQLVLAANSYRELAYQQKVLAKIMDETEASMCVDLSEIPGGVYEVIGELIESMGEIKVPSELKEILHPASLWWGLIRASFPPAIFRFGGTFTMTFGCDETIDVGCAKLRSGQR